VLSEAPATVAAVDAALSADAPAERRLDPESRRWLDELAAEGPAREQAVARLHELLLRAAYFELNRRRHMLSPGDLDDLAVQAADDALVAVLARLGDFRGASRFTTWAYKFALLEAAVRARRAAWRGREIPLEPDSWPSFGGPERDVEQAELLRVVREGITEALTPHQRDVLVALVGNDVPIDVLAERLGTTRGALYKTLHDARRKLRRHVAAAGFAEGADDVG
jgi:RNA polymerase sigma-70 factor, ECF subfamily